MRSTVARRYSDGAEAVGGWKVENHFSKLVLLAALARGGDIASRFPEEIVAAFVIDHKIERWIDIRWEARNIARIGRKAEAKAKIVDTGHCVESSASIVQHVKRVLSNVDWGGGV